MALMHHGYFLSLCTGLFYFVPKDIFCMYYSSVAGVQASASHTSQQVCVGMLFILDPCWSPAAWQACDMQSQLGCQEFHLPEGNMHHPIVYSCHRKKLLDVLLLKNLAMNSFFVIFLFIVVSECEV